MKVYRLYEKFFDAETLEAIPEEECSEGFFGPYFASKENAISWLIAEKMLANYRVFDRDLEWASLAVAARPDSVDVYCGWEVNRYLFVEIDVL